MKHPGPKVGGHHLVQRETRVREHGLIHRQRVPIRSQDDDGLRDGIDDLSQLRFCVLQLGIQVGVFQRNGGLRGQQLQHREPGRGEHVGGQIVLEIEHPNQRGLVH